MVFLTGASALVYQVVWQRYLARMLGAETLGVALVLAIFLAGLAAGYLMFGALSRRLRRPIIVYAAIEAVVAGWGILFPKLYSTVYSLTLDWSFAPPFAMVGQGFIVSLILIGVPTVCMGATVPMLTRGLSTSISVAPRTHALLYAVNTFGACSGALLTGFFLIELLGLPATVHTAAALNILAAGGLFVIGRNIPDAPNDDSVSSTDSDAAATPRLTSPYLPIQLLVVAFMSGAYVMALENVLIRVMNITLGSSTYNFTIIVAVFILAIATGAAVVGRIRSPSPYLLFWNQFWILASLLFLFMTIDKWPYAAHVIRTAFQDGFSGFVAFQIAIFGALMLLLIVPISLMGATVPIAFGELRRELHEVGWHSGLLLGINGVGCLLGSLIGGVLIFVWVDIGGAFLANAVLAAVSLLVLSLTCGKERIALAVGMACITVLFCIKMPLFDDNRLVLGTFRLRGETPYTFTSPENFYRHHLLPYRIPWKESGPSNSVGVLEFDSSEHPAGFLRSLIANGRSESVAGGGDQPTLALVAHIPALFAQQRDSMLIIGLGTGVTAGELSLYDDFRKIVVAEISTSVANALPMFDPYLHRLIGDPRFQLRLGDALRLLKRSPEMWDVIISEPSNPFITGVDQLYTAEFYDIVRSKLKPGGVFMQWLQLYDTAPEIVAMINLTLMSRFDNLYYFQGSPGDLLILATDSPLGETDRLRAEQTLRDNPRILQSTGTFEVNSLDDILKRTLPGVLPIVITFNNEIIEMEDTPKLHYLAGRAFYRGEPVTPAVKQLASDPLAKALARRYADNWRSDDPIPVFKDLPKLVEQIAEEERIMQQESEADSRSTADPESLPQSEDSHNSADD